MNLFIDTNVFLSFYHLTNDDLEELRKLSVLLRSKKLVLFLPSQVQDEFNRNRDNKIADAMKRLRDAKLSLQFPQFCKEYTEYIETRNLQRDFEAAHRRLVERVTEDIKNRSLTADTLTKELFSLAQVIPGKAKLFAKAWKRVLIGNPPGKKDSLGDAINWETLLVEVPDLEDLHFISDDGDYWSPLSEDCFHTFLIDEWKTKKYGQIFPYRRLSQFFTKHFPEIQLASEYEKYQLIKALENSSNFARTHTVISKLQRYTDFSPSQINTLIAAGISNSQVSWIMQDDDVSTFFSNLIVGNESIIDAKLLHELNVALGNVNGEQAAMEPQEASLLDQIESSNN